MDIGERTSWIPNDQTLQDDRRARMRPLDGILARAASRIEEEMMGMMLHGSTVAASTKGCESSISYADIVRMKEEMDAVDPGTLHIGCLSEFIRWVGPDIAQRPPGRDHRMEGLTFYRPNLYGLPIIEDLPPTSKAFIHKDKDGEVIGIGFIGRGFVWRK